MSQSIKCGINVVAAYSLIEEMSELSDYLNQTFGLTFSEGVGANQVNLIFHDQRPLGDGANETLDFHDGSLTNKVGQTITLDKFKFMLVKNNSTDSTLIVGGAAGNQLALFADVSDKEVLQPGGVKLFLAPDADGVDCSVNADLKFEHGGEGTSAPKYDLIVAGVDAP